MKAKPVSKFLAVALAVVMLFSAIPMSALAASVDYVAHDDYYKVITKDDYELAPGVVESEIVLNNAAGTHRQVAHVVEVDINNPYTKVIPSYKGMIPTPGSYGVQIMSEQAKWAEANGYGNVVAAMNISLSWYDSAYYLQNPHLVGEPLGYMILDGVQYTNSQGKTAGAQTCAVINFDEKDGVARPADIPKVEIRSTSSPITGWEEQVIPANFGFLVKDGKNQYSKDNNAANGASRSFMGVKADGTFVMVMNDGRQAPFSTGFTNYEMAEFMLSLGCVAAVNGDGGGSSAFLSQRPGEELKINCSPSDGAERDTTHGVLVISTAPATGEFVRATISAENDYYTPGSTVTFSAVGTDLVGTPADIPADATWQLADPSMGTIENGVFVSNGKVGTATAQIVYGGEVVGESSIEIVIPEKIEFTQSNIVVPFGKTAQLAVVATINEGIHEVVLKDGDVTLSLDNQDLGTLDPVKFTFAAVDENNVPENLTATLTATLNHGDGLVATVPFSIGKGSDIVYDFEDQDLTGWSIYTNYGKYGPVGPNGKVTDADGNYWYHGQNERGYLSIVDKNSGEVRNGDYALAVECDFSQLYETGYHALNLMFPTIDCTDSLQIGFWIYIPYDMRHAEMNIGSTGYGNGRFYEYNEGWHYIKAQAKNNQFYYVNISVDDRAADTAYNNYNYITEPNLGGKFTFYIDDITVDYSTAVDDRENPVFGNVEMLGNDSGVALGNTPYTTTNNMPTFEVKVADDTTLGNASGLNADSAVAYIDGKAVECTFKNGKMSVAGVKLADGVHEVRFEIADNAGNSMWAGGKVNVVTANDTSSTVKVVPHKPDLYRPFIGSLYWMDVVASDIETIEKVEMVFDLNNDSSWELEGMEAAPGFEATYSIQEDDNLAYVTVTRVGENAQTGEAVLVTFPVRTWESTITEYEGYEDQTPATLVNRGIIWKHSIELALQRGIITYVSDYVSDTTGTFGMDDLTVDTEVFFTNYVRKSVTGAQEWINEKKAANVGWHEHTVVALEDKAATCDQAGYSNRTYCEGCDSVIEWGEKVEATGHTYEVIDGVVKCACGELFNGVYTDGKEYVDGVVIADGWVGESYYVDGVKLTGVNLIDGKYYDFGENGICAGNMPLSLWYTNDNGESFYLNGGVPVEKYTMINSVPTFFSDEGVAYQGEFVINGETCVFEKGAFVKSTTADVRLAGRVGDTVNFVLYNDGRLVICGEGETWNFVSVGTSYLPKLSWKNRPWGNQNNDYSKSIKKVFIGKDITVIGDMFLQQCYNIEEIKFEEGSKLHTLKTFAFHYAQKVKSVELPDSLKTMEYSALGYCANLVNVKMPERITNINARAFWNNNAALKLNVAEGSYAQRFAETNSLKYTTRASVPVVVENGTCGEGLTWELYSDGVLYINGNGEMANYTYGKYDKTAQPWAFYRDSIKKIVIGAGVEKIGAFAFYGCNKVTAVEFAANSTLTFIGDGAFGYIDALKSITLPASLKTLDQRVFYFSGLETVAFEEGSKLNAIGAYAFRNCANLKTVYIPDGVTSIGSGIIYAVEANVVLNVAKDSYAHTYATARKYNVTVREPMPTVKYNGTCGDGMTWELYDNGVLYINGNGVVADYNYGKYAANAQPWALYRDQIKKIVIGAGVEKIGAFAFYGCNKVTAVEFAANSTLTFIGDGAFGYMDALKSITLPASLKTLDQRVFYFSGLETVAFEEGSKLNAIGAYAFRNCANLKTVYIPDGVTSFGSGIIYAIEKQVVLNVADGSFAHTYAVSRGYSFTVREPMPTVKYDGTCGDGMTWELYDNGVLYINGNGAMADYNYGKYAANAQPWALQRDLITKIVIGEGVEKIGAFAFYGCNKVTAVEFAANSTLTFIGDGAFGYMDALKSITLPASVEELDQRVFYFSGLETVTVEDGSNLAIVGSYAFRNCANLKTVELPEGVSMGSGVFYACNNLNK